MGEIFEEPMATPKKKEPKNMSPKEEYYSCTKLYLSPKVNCSSWNSDICQFNIHSIAKQCTTFQDTSVLLIRLGKESITMYFPVPSFAKPEGHRTCLPGVYIQEGEK